MTDQNNAWMKGTYATPNYFCDSYLALLTGEEWKILSYIIRRTLGTKSGREDDFSARISIDEYANGILEKGRRLDCGTGLCRDGIVRAVAALKRFGFISHPEGSERKNSNSALVRLSQERDRIRIDLLEERLISKKRATDHKMSKLRSRKSSSVVHIKDYRKIQG